MSLREVLEFYDVPVRDRERQLVLCPLGHESHPSCSVDLDRGLWHCHSCGEGGDAISLIRTKESCDYPTALRFLADIPGAGDGEVRAERGRGRRVARGKGFRPKYRRSIPARRRYDP